MKNFSKFGITTTNKGLTGDKIKIEKVLNRPITVEGYRITDSKFEGKGKRLDLQVKINESRHVIFTSGLFLMEALEQVPKGEFPFMATIVKENDRLEFR